MKTIINPEYTYLESYIRDLPNLFTTEGEFIYEGRNALKTFDVDRGKIVVKSFRPPHLINRIAYSFFRSSKAECSFNHANILIRKKIDTPVPIAYIEKKKAGLIFESYYISSYIDYPGILRELGYYPLEETRELVREFALFTAFLHDKDVLHKDYSPGNILYEKRNGQYHFCLVDVNRMSFGKVDENKAAFNLRRLWGSDETIGYIARIYAKERKFEVDPFVQKVLFSHKKFWKNFSRKYPGCGPVRYNLSVE